MKISIREILDPLIVGFNLSQSMNFCGLGLGSFSKSGSRILRGSVARIWLTMRVNYVYVHIGFPRQRRHIAISKPPRRALQVAFVDIERIYPTHLVWGCSLARLVFAAFFFFLRPRRPHWKPANF